MKHPKPTPVRLTEGHRKKLEDRLVWLEEAKVRLANNQKRVPYTLLSAVLGLPVGWMFGLEWGVFSVLMAPFLTGVSWYILFNHQLEVKHELRSVNEQLRADDALRAQATEAPNAA